jgi:hypothetical protein
MYPNNFLILLLISTSISCTNSNNKTFALDDKQTNVVSNKNAEALTHPIPSNVDENFKIFITYFSNDSAFQLSRIQFPLKVKELDDDFELAERTIQSINFRRMNFGRDKLVNNYSQNIKVKGEKAVIEIRGIENGITADYYFENINGKWFLTTWTNSST